MTNNIASPVISDAFLYATEDVSAFFYEVDGRLPVCTCETAEEIVVIGQALKRKDVHTQWRKAALAAVAIRRGGQRTDLGDGPTPVQELARVWAVGTAYVSRLARVHHEFDEPDDPRITELITDEFFSFKHFLIAATYAPAPKLALIEARQLQWSANALARFLAAQQRRDLIDAATARPVSAVADNDDIDPDWRGLQERPRTDTPRGLKPLPWRLTKRQHLQLAARLRDLSVVLGTQSDVDTVLAIVERAHHELVHAADVTWPENGGAARSGDADPRIDPARDLVQKYEGGA